MNNYKHRMVQVLALSGAAGLAGVLLTLFPAFLHAQDQNFSDVRIITHPVADNIYYLQGSGGNIGVSVGQDGVFIIDDQFAPLTEKIRAAVAEISDRPVQFVFNTHFHYDHTGGNENFGGAGAVLVAHDNARKRMSVDNFLQVVNVQQEAYDPEGLPKITFEDGMTFHYNGQTINVYHFGPAHTDGDAIVHFVEADVLHTGDVFVRYGLPFIDVPNGGNINGMIRVMHRLVSMADENTKIIPGHGQLSGRQDMVDYVEMLETIRDRVFEGIRAGKSLEEITAQEPTRGYPQQGLLDNASFTKIVYDSFFQ